MYDIQYIDIKGEKLQKKNKGLQLMCKKKGGKQTEYTCRLVSFKS